MDWREVNVKCLTEWTRRYPLKCVAVGSGLLGLPPKSPIKGDNKVHLFMGMAPRLNIVSCVTLGFTEYGMTNASNFKWASAASKPQRVRKGKHLFMGKRPRLKTMSNLSLGSPEYDRKSARNFGCGLPPASNTHRDRKRALI